MNGTKGISIQADNISKDDIIIRFFIMILGFN